MARAVMFAFRRVFVTILACCLAMQWLGGGMAAHAAGAGPADPQAQSSFAPDKIPCDAAREVCSSTAHPCTPPALPGARAALIVGALHDRLPEPCVVFTDYFPGRSVPPPLTVPA